ncbi:hypothetical protein [Mesomycoplasma dispar]|uniref:Uncharacterized protein n=1 Tax=Mesomycoplasma dispar TaxID=86660 RepID=A0ABM6PRC7_9BACT|nr:hypothetical protein [Mesomycoplasma dispar]ATP59761.1 hypothetical protein CSW10_02335 [Mesomycoplasma dispar]
MDDKDFEVVERTPEMRFLEFIFFFLILMFILSIIQKTLNHKFLITFYFRKVFNFFLKLEQKEKTEINQIFLTGYEKAKEIIAKNNLKVKIITLILAFLLLAMTIFFILYKIFIFSPNNIETSFLFMHPESFVQLAFQTIFLPSFVYLQFGVRKKLLTKFEKKIKNFNFIAGDNYFFDRDYENFELPETKIPRKSGNLHSKKRDNFPLSFIILRKYFSLWKLKTDELINLYYFLIWGSHLQESDSTTPSYQFLYKDFVMVLKNQKKDKNAI